MDRELLKDHFEKSRFSPMQADALSRVLGDMEARLATKADLAALRGEMTSLRESVRADLSGMEARLTWRMIAVVVFMGTVMTLVGAFLG